MWTRHRRRLNRSRFILPLLSVGVCSYFAYHIYHGQYGLQAHENVMRQMNLLQAEHARLEQKQQFLQKHIALLKDGTVEKDTLDEYARHNLNLARANELIIILPD